MIDTIKKIVDVCYTWFSKRDHVDMVILFMLSLLIIPDILIAIFCIGYLFWDAQKDHSELEALIRDIDNLIGGNRD